MRIARRVSQILFGSAFGILFLLAVFPLQTRIPVDFFLRLDPLTSISAGIAARSWIPHAVSALALLALTVFLGRFFCGWICPLGTTIDAFDRAAGAKPKNDPKRGGIRLTWVKFFLLTVFLVASVFSVQVAGYLDPMPLLTRTLTTAVYPAFVSLIEGFVGFLSGVPGLADPAQKADAFLRGFLLPVSSAVFRGAVWIGLGFALLLGLGLLQKRFWCRNLCPLGALLGIFSIVRPYRRFVGESCTSCGICRNRCRMGAIGPDFKSTDHAECVNCMDCAAVCPAGAVRFSVTVRPKPSPVSLSRRRFLGAGTVGLASVGLLNAGFRNPVSRGKVVRPPGALTENAFLDRCVRCGECVRVCASSGQGLQHAGLEAGWTGIATPALCPPHGYCEYNCNLCGKVCPTGAIRPLALEDKQIIKMGTAHFDKTRCIPWYYGENCMVCEEHCPIPEKAIKFRDVKTLTIDGRETRVLLPYVVEEFCVGCGICSCRCPLDGEKGIFVTNAGEQRS
jgi:polyferredoxin